MPACTSWRLPPGMSVPHSVRWRYTILNRWNSVLHWYMYTKVPWVYGTSKAAPASVRLTYHYRRCERITNKLVIYSCLWYLRQAVYIYEWIRSQACYDRLLFANTSLMTLVNIVVFERVNFVSKTRQENGLSNETRVTCRTVELIMTHSARTDHFNSFVWIDSKDSVQAWC